jgi:sulfatase maturation enzyme AslB (radical SAM superfamily)
MILSINPWYYCNFRCEFCYLTEKQLSDKKLLSLDKLANILGEIVAHKQIDMVDLYGGELGLLPKEYWNDLIQLLHNYGIYDINLITNLSMINDITIDERVYTSVSYDFKAREDFFRVWKNMALMNKPFSILMLASPGLISESIDDIVSMFNSLKNLESVEIKPYSKNQANQFSIKDDIYEEYVKKWILHKDRKFKLVNESLLESVVNRSRNSFSDDHVYITPNGKYGVLEFDLNDNEYFLEYDTLDEYFAWCETEKKRVSKNKFCSSCKYFGRCLSEHLRDVKSLDNSCNGYYKLIDWYERLENKTRNIS